MKPSDSERLSDVDPEFARLVSALRSGGPSKDAIARTLDAVGSVATGAPVTKPIDSRPAKSAALAVGAGAIALIVAAAGYEWSVGTTVAPAATSPVVVAPVHEEAAPPEVPAASMRVEDLPPAATPEPEPLPSSAPRASSANTQKPSAPAARPAPPAAPSAAVDDFRDELALVERVRTQLSSGETEACLRSIDQYAQRFNGGAFVQEVEVMRVEALAASGDGERARSFGGKFLSEHPTSPYTGRVRSVLEKSR